MKKFLSIMLVCLMVLSALSVMAFSVSAETVELEGTKYQNGMENWANSTTKPEGHPAAFELLFGVKYTNGFDKATAEAAYAAKDSLTWTLIISENADMSNAITKSMAPASVFYMTGYACFRFETALAEDPWAPVKGTTYYINATVKGEGVDYAVTGPADGFVMNDEPITKDYQAPVIDGPQPITIAPAFSHWENWVNSPNNPDGAGAAPGVTQLLVGITSNGIFVDISKDLTWKLHIVGGDQDKTITLSPATIDSAYNLYRFETCLGEGENKFVPVNGVSYTVTIEVFDGEEKVYYSEPTAGFNCPMDPVDPDAGDVTPPDDGGDVTPPDDGGDVTPPDDGGDVTPPDDGGDVTPPDDGGDVTPPEDDDDTTPPAADGEDDGEDDGGNTTVIIIVAVAAVVAIAAVVAVLLKKKKA